MYLTEFKDAHQAYAFVNYMKSKNISIDIEVNQNENYQLILNDNDKHKIALVEQELVLYLNDPASSRNIQPVWENENFHHNIVKRNSSLSQLIPQLVPVGIVTKSVAIISIILYVLMTFLGFQHIFNYLMYPKIFNYLELWRYITPIFLHFSLLHILFNLVWWWNLGGVIEQLKGKWKLIQIVLISGVLSNSAEAYFSTVYFGGLSGVVYALMGYVWLQSEHNPSSGFQFSRSMIGFAIMWLIAGYAGFLGAIANTAHLAGLIIGLLLAAIDIWLSKNNH